MSDATITALIPKALERTTARDCGVARVIELPSRPSGRLIEPLGAAPTSRAGDVDPFAPRYSYDPGPLARALMAMSAADAR